MSDEISERTATGRRRYREQHAEEAEHLALAHVERHVVHGDEVTEIFLEVVDLDLSHHSLRKLRNNHKQHDADQRGDK